MFSCVDVSLTVDAFNLEGPVFLTTWILDAFLKAWLKYLQANITPCENFHFINHDFFEIQTNAPKGEGWVSVSPKMKKLMRVYLYLQVSCRYL